MDGELSQLLKLALFFLGIISLIIFPLLLQLNKKLRNVLSQLRNEKKELNNFLQHFSNTLADPDSLKDAANTICRYVSEQIGCESVVIYKNVEGTLTFQGVYGPYSLIPSRNPNLLDNEKLLAEALKICKFTVGDGSFVGDIAVNQTREILNDGSLDDRFANTINPGAIRGVIGDVLLHDDKVYGVIVVVNSKHAHHKVFDRNQIEQLSHLTTQIVLMHQLIDSYAMMNQQDRIDQELRFARQIQDSLLPKSLPKWAQFSINAYTRPAKEVNGDFYDFVKIDDDRLLIVIGDACGKGVPACMLSAMTRSFIRALADKFTTLQNFLLELNDKIYSDTDDCRFITVNCCLLDKRNSLLEFGRAGHTELITFVHNHLRVIYPDGSALGILPSEDTNFDTFCLAFEYGMSFMVFSDGLTEAVNENNEEYGLERLKNAFHQAIQKGYSSDQVIAEILNDVEKFATSQIDDQTMILIRYV